MSSTNTVINKQTIRGSHDDVDPNQQKKAPMQHLLKLLAFVVVLVLLAYFSVSDGALVTPSSDTDSSITVE